MDQAQVVPAGLPPSEVRIDDELVRSLLAEQQPDLAELPLRRFATGWDNVTYRLGEDLAVRLPRIEAAVALLRKEQQWLPALAGRLPVSIPVPLRLGEPGCGYPWPWSVVPWAPGRSAEHEDLASSEAEVFGRFLAAMHVPAPDGMPRNDYRGIPLSTQAEKIEQRLDRLAALPPGLTVPLAEVRERWQAVLGVPIDVEDRWIHGDLHPKNIVVDQGRLAAVIDWGDMTVGDPATDLGAAFMLFPVDVHGQVWNAYGDISPDTARRAVGWALFFGVTVLEVGAAGDPYFTDIGRRTLARVCATST